MNIKIMNIKFTKFALAASMFTTLSTGAVAQNRVIEDSLVYDDPTVARPGQWIYGAGIGAYYSNSNTSGTDTSGNTVNATQQFTQPQVSVFVGYSDVTLLLRYQRISATTQFPGNKMTNKGNTLSADLRYLITPLQAKYFVPYVLASYVDQTENETFSFVNNNGLQQTGKVVAKGPGLGIGGIVPITEKYGVRLDVKQYNLTATVTSNMYAGLNSSRNLQYRMGQATAYYNLSNHVNIQIGGQATYVPNQSQSTSYGFITMLGVSY